MDNTRGAHGLAALLWSLHGRMTMGDLSYSDAREIVSNVAQRASNHADRIDGRCPRFPAAENRPEGA